ncbi:MAG: zinc finger domain-containing protein, partial [Acidobacteriota bacterium]
VLRPVAEDPKFTHALFGLDGGDRLVYSDQRHFGMMKTVDTSSVNSTREIAKLAPEPFSDEFSKKYLRHVLDSSNRSVKEVLTDQTKVCGLGNIYAAEALHISRIDPQMESNSISSVKSNRLHAAIIYVLQKAMAHSTLIEPAPDNFEGTYYSSGAEVEWSVYDREGMPCPRCGQPIARIAQGGRSTYYCKKCQKRRSA